MALGGQEVKYLCCTCNLEWAEDRLCASLGYRSICRLSETGTLVDVVDLATEAGVDHPSHYHAESGIEVIDAIEAWNLGFRLGNAVKYISRAGLKDRETRLKDLKKALWYLQREIAQELSAKK